MCIWPHEDSVRLDIPYAKPYRAYKVLYVDDLTNRLYSPYFAYSRWAKGSKITSHRPPTIGTNDLIVGGYGSKAGIHCFLLKEDARRWRESLFPADYPVEVFEILAWGRCVRHNDGLGLRAEKAVIPFKWSWRRKTAIDTTVSPLPPAPTIPPVRN